MTLYDQIVQRFSDIYGAIQQYVGTEPNVRVMARTICSVSHMRYVSVLESIRYLIGQTLTDDEASRLAMRLAGNTSKLRRGKVVLPWMGQVTDEIVLSVIRRVVVAKNHKGQIGFNVTVLFMTGSPAGLRCEVFWSRKMARYAASLLGFSSRNGKYPYHDGVELVGMRFNAHVVPERSSDSPGFYEIRCTDGLRRQNREILDMRYRRNGFSCPEGYSHPCRQCAVGLDRCPAATHRDSYVRGSCADCLADSVPMDPEDGGDLCIQCARKQRLRREERGNLRVGHSAGS